MKRKFGRLIKFDRRSRKYPIRTLIAQKEPRSYTWPCGVVLDQGSEGACTGFAVAHEAAAWPCRVWNITEKVARAIYKRARQIDEWPGENYEGSSVLAAMKAGQERGWYREYRWAFGEEDLALAVSRKGPCVLGINWYEGMSEPDIKNYIHPTGEILGGHAILCRGYNVKKECYTLHNSWGRGWGIYGTCYISKADMAKLLNESGEACIPVIRTK
jgi:hypothetical protein